MCCGETRANQEVGSTGSSFKYKTSINVNYARTSTGLSLIFCLYNIQGNEIITLTLKLTPIVSNGKGERNLVTVVHQLLKSLFCHSTDALAG